MIATSRRPIAPRIALLAAVVAASVLQAGTSRADYVVDFENNPSLPAQPNNFADAGAMQAYSQAGVYSITGGVVLGNPNFLAAFAANGSAPNLYGTADFADPSLLPTITLALLSAEGVAAVSGVVFNGHSVSETYTLTASSNGTTVGTSTITLDPATSTTDFYNFSFASTSALPITSVTFTTPNASINGYDFFVDTIHIIPGIVTAVPEPSTSLMLAQVGVVGLAAGWLRRKRAAAGPVAAANPSRTASPRKAACEMTSTSTLLDGLGPRPGRSRLKAVIRWADFG